MKYFLELQGRKKKNSQGKVYYYYVDAGYDTHHVCKALHINRDELEGFVIEQIGKLLANGEYEDRFKRHLKKNLIAVEKDVSFNLPLLKKQHQAIENEIDIIVDELFQVRSDTLRKRLLKKERERDNIAREIQKLSTVGDGLSQIIKSLNNVGDILKLRSHREQKKAVKFFLEGGGIDKG